MPSPTATTRATVTEMSVARTKLIRFASAARRIRPPSIGSAGTRLNAASTTLIQPTRLTSSLPVRAPTPRPRPPSMIDTAGPAAAIAIS